MSYSFYLYLLGLRSMAKTCRITKKIERPEYKIATVQKKVKGDYSEPQMGCRVPCCNIWPLWGNLRGPYYGKDKYRISGLNFIGKKTHIT